MPGPLSGATFDRSRRYRYRLWRTFDRGRGAALFVMLNPSRADAVRDDPTIRRCIGFALAWGYRSVTVVNLFALRSPDPTRLARARDPVGAKNDRHIRAAARAADLVVAAWGIHGDLFGRDRDVLELLRGAPLACLGRTRDGHPRHPLYLPAATALEPLAA